MNWKAIGAIGEIVGAIAVFATLFYLAKQIRLSNRIAVSTSDIELRNSMSSLNQAIYSDSDLAKILSKAKEPDSQFDAVEITKFECWTREMLSMWFSAEIAFKNGVAPTETYNVVFDNIRELLEQYPLCRKMFRQHLQTYPAVSDSKIIKYIDEVLKEHSE